MTEDPVNLDKRRSAEGKMAADIRRHEIAGFEAAEEKRRRRQVELEAQLLAEPGSNWREVAFKAQYLIRCYSETSDAKEPRRHELIRKALADLARLIKNDEESQ